MTRAEQVAFVQHVNTEMAALLHDLKKVAMEPFSYRAGSLRIVGTIVRRPEKRYPKAEVKFDPDQHKYIVEAIFSSEPRQLITGSEHGTLIVEWRLQIGTEEQAA